MVQNIRQLLHRHEKTNTLPCIVCSDLTRYTSKCQCKLRICKKCLKKWLGRKRQCMVCKDDLLEAEEWINSWLNPQMRDDLEAADFAQETVAQLVAITVQAMDNFELLPQELRFFWMLLLNTKFRIATEIRSIAFTDV